MPPRRSNRLKTWRQSHGNRLKIGRQRRGGLPGMVGTRQRPQRPGNADSERGISPTSARVMLETRLIEGMLLGRSAECCRSHDPYVGMTLDCGQINPHSLPPLGGFGGWK